MGWNDGFPGSVVKLRDDEGLPLLYASDCFYEMTGFTPEEIRDRFEDRFLDLIHPDDVGPVFRALTQCRLENRFESRAFRILPKQGDWLWTLCQFNRDPSRAQGALLCLLVDITGFKNAQEALRKSVERHQAILDQTADVMFEWDLVEDQISLSLNWAKRFGYFPELLSVEDILRSDKMIHPDDRNAFRTLAAKVRAGARFVQADVRIQNAYGQMAWCRIRGTTQYGANGQPLKAVGVILNIDEEREMVKQLRERAEHDALTGLYNKITTQSLIQEYLRNMGPEDIGALLLLDIDDFKRLNDTRGHLHGDSVLAQASSAMRKMIRSSDIVGRIGGDEFMVFIKNIPCEASAVHKAEQLIETLRKTPFSFTCSIGVAVARGDQSLFNELYQAADQALYQAKKTGKGRACLYSGEFLGGFSDEAACASVIGAPIDSDQRAFGLLRQVVEHIFHVMPDTDDLIQAVDPILAFIGKRFDVSRALIWEGALDGRTVNKAFEWRNGNGSSDEPWPEGMDPCALRECSRHMDADGCFYCDDAEAAPDLLQAYMKRNQIRSTHICSFRRHGMPGGLVCFEQRDGRRVWAYEDLEALTVSSRILGILLLKAREQERGENSARQMLALLDHQPCWVYVADPADHRLLYCNQTLARAVPEIRAGMKCFEALSCRTAPCDGCPMALARRGQRGEAELLGTPAGQWSSMHAVPIVWEKRDAYLLTGYDIRRYKEAL